MNRDYEPRFKAGDIVSIKFKGNTGAFPAYSISTDTGNQKEYTFIGLDGKTYGNPYDVALHDTVKKLDLYAKADQYIRVNQDEVKDRITVVSSDTKHLPNVLRMVGLFHYDCQNYDIWRAFRNDGGYHPQNEHEAKQMYQSALRVGYGEDEKEIKDFIQESKRSVMKFEMER